MNKEAKKCIQYYTENIQSEEYKSYLVASNEERFKTHREYVKENKPEWIERTDYYEPDFISSISFFDIADNQGIIKLLRKLHSLQKSKYNVRNYYKKPGKLKAYDYIRLKYSNAWWGRFAEIDLLEDQYVSNICITWCQINSYFAFLVYEIHFKKPLDEIRYHDFIRDTLQKLTGNDYILWYPAIKNIQGGKMDGHLLETMDQEFFPVACQHYVTSLLYSEQGHKGPLINMIFHSRKAAINIDKVYLGDGDFSYYNKKENYYIGSDYNQITYYLCAGDNQIPTLSVLGLVAEYGNKFYYHFAGYLELKRYEEDFSKYFSGRKQIAYDKKCSSLIRKMKSMADVENGRGEDFSVKFAENWDFYIANDKYNFSEHVKKVSVDFQTIYQENFSYLQMLSDMKYTRMSFINSVLATIASIVATIVAITALIG